jgi:CHAT domain-containing protein
MGVIDQHIARTLALVTAVLIGLAPRWALAEPVTVAPDPLQEGRIRAAIAKQDLSQGLRIANAWLRAREGVDGPGSPTVIPALRWRGYVQALSNHTAEALADYTQVHALGEQFMEQKGPLLSNIQLAGALQYFAVDRDLALSLAADHPEDPAVTALALLISRSQKGRLMELAAARQAQFRILVESQPNDAELIRLLRDNDRIRVDYAHIALAAVQPFDAATTARLRDFEAQIASNETTVARRYWMAATVPNAQLIRYRPELLGAATPGIGNWYIDYAEFLHYDTGKDAAGRPPTREYLGFLTRGDGKIVTVRLGSAAEIDALAERLLAVLSDPTKDYRTAAEEGYRRLVQPLADKAVPKISPSANDAFEAGVVNRYIGIFPDGNLNLVAFQALHTGSAFLGDLHKIWYVGSALDLGVMSRSALNPKYAVDVFADPDFRFTVPAGGAGNSDLSFLGGAPIEPLSATKAEAAAIKALLPGAMIHEGSEASRQRFLDMPAPGILHLATHGMFMDEGAAPSAGPLETTDTPANAPYHGLALAPLIGTGFVLAGSPSDPMGGVVSATDILNMNLTGTQLVVLSACETARGFVRPGDSVYGLRQAFLLAGAETVVASLWEIDDAATQSLMTRYYKNLARGLGRLEAMVEAARKEKKQHPHPAYWAAFTVMGGMGGLRGSAGAAIPPIELPTGGYASGYRPPAPTPPPEPAAAVFAADKPGPPVIRDCARCPPLIAVPGIRGGSLLMGKFEVTFEDWAACEEEKGCSVHPDMPFYGRVNKPVINVSFDDVQTYLAWLSKKTRKTYRLPTQAEWTWAARGGGADPVLAGRRTANCYGCDDETEGKEPAPVGSHEANGFGLYDLLGNVWELTSDCRDEGCTQHLALGGSFVENYQNASSEAATTLAPGLRLNSVGFRVVRLPDR